MIFPSYRYSGHTMMAEQAMELAPQYFCQRHDYLKTDCLDETMACFRVVFDDNTDSVATINRRGRWYKRQIAWSCVKHARRQLLEFYFGEAFWPYLCLGDALQKTQSEEVFSLRHRGMQRGNKSPQNHLLMLTISPEEEWGRKFIDFFQNFRNQRTEVATPELPQPVDDTSLISSCFYR